MSRRDPEALRLQILEAATRLFAQRGYAGSSVAAVADEVGISRQLLLYHFSTKEGLRAAVLQRIADTWREVLPRLLDVATQPGGSVPELFGSTLDLADAHPHAARFVLRDLISDEGQVEGELNDMVQPLLRLAAQRIAQEQAQGRLDPALDPPMVVEMLGMLLLTWFAVQRRDQRPAQRARRRAELLRIMQATVGRRAPAKG